MKIVDVDVYVVDPAKGGTPNSVEYPDIWTFVRVRTDEGVHGWGECTNFPGNGSLMIADAIHHLKPWIVGAGRRRHQRHVAPDLPQGGVPRAARACPRPS